MFLPFPACGMHIYCLVYFRPFSIPQLSVTEQILERVYTLITFCSTTPQNLDAQSDDHNQLLPYIQQRRRPTTKSSGRRRAFSTFRVFVGLRLGTPAVHDANNGIGATKNGIIPFPTSIGNKVVLCRRRRSRGGGRSCAFSPLFPPTPVRWSSKSARCLDTTRFIRARAIPAGGVRRSTGGGGGGIRDGARKLGLREGFRMLDVTGYALLRGVGNAQQSPSLASFLLG